MILALGIGLRDGEEVFCSVVGGVVPYSTGLVSLFKKSYICEGFLGDEISGMDIGKTFMVDVQVK